MIIEPLDMTLVGSEAVTIRTLRALGCDCRVSVTELRVGKGG